MINRLTELKNKATERAGYYSRIDFPNLANEFTEFVNFLNEMEDIIKENEELKAQVQAYEAEATAKVEETRAAREGEECCD